MCWHHSQKRTILSTTRPEGQTSEGESRDQLQARIGHRSPHNPTPRLLCLNPVVAGLRRSSSTDQIGAQSPYRSHTWSRRQPCAKDSVSPLTSVEEPPGSATTGHLGAAKPCRHRQISTDCLCRCRWAKWICLVA
jgi:hypothetical protein